MSHHHHDNGPHHHHHQDTASEMSLEQKLEKLLDHWVKHNEDHAKTYEQWADRAREGGMGPVADILEKAAKANVDLNTLLNGAQKALEK